MEKERKALKRKSEKRETILKRRGDIDLQDIQNKV